MSKARDELSKEIALKYPISVMNCHRGIAVTLSAIHEIIEAYEALALSPVDALNDINKDLLARLKKTKEEVDALE